MLKQLVLVSTLTITNFAFAQKNDPVVATVNGTKIMKSDVDKAYLLNRYVVSKDTVTTKKVLTDLINKEIGIQRAKKAGLDKDKIVVEKMEDVLFHAQVSKDLEPKFKRISVTDKDVDTFYKEFPEYRTAHILLRVRVAPSATEIDEAQKRIFDIYKQIKADPSKFSELANKFSQSTNAETGGDIGYKAAFYLAPEYFRAIKGKSVDTITEPVRTQYGYHIIKVLGVKDRKDIDVPTYKKFVYDQKRDKIIEEYFAGLRKKASVNIIDSKLK